MAGRADKQTVAEILRLLKDTYCRYIGVQFMHINDPGSAWLQERMESCGNRIELSRDEQLRILTRLTDATIFEEFVRKKYIGAKTFSLEGAESLIPLLDLAIERRADEGVEEIVLGHGASRATERAGQHHWQTAARDLLGIQRPEPELLSWQWRCDVSPWF